MSEGLHCYKYQRLEQEHERGLQILAGIALVQKDDKPLSRAKAAELKYEIQTARNCVNELLKTHRETCCRCRQIKASPRGSHRSP